VLDASKSEKNYFKISMDAVPFCKKDIEKDLKGGNEEAMCLEADPMDPQSLALSCKLSYLWIVLLWKLGCKFAVFGL
jgi:hypothetical protein